jgi:integrase
MKKKDRRNLYLRGDAIYYQRVVEGARIRFSTKTTDWDKAAQARDLYEARKRIGTLQPIVIECPRFAALADQFLKAEKKRATSDGEGCAVTTLDDLSSLLREKGPILPHLGVLRVDEIRRAHLAAWWEAEVVGRELAYQTGLNYLSAISSVLLLALERDYIEANPARAFRETLRLRRRTKQGRAAAQRRDTRHPIERVADLRAFVEASEQAGRSRFGNGHRKIHRHRGYVADLLMLDAGLRPGEVAGLRWRHVQYGSGPDDPERRLEIVESIARCRYEGRPRSGRERTVPLSRRLRRVLREYWLAEGQPKPDVRVVPGFRSNNYARRHFDEVLKAAKLDADGYTPRDLRATFASHLVSVG